MLLVKTPAYSESKRRGALSQNARENTFIEVPARCTEPALHFLNPCTLVHTLLWQKDNSLKSNNFDVFIFFQFLRLADIFLCSPPPPLIFDINWRFVHRIKSALSLRRLADLAFRDPSSGYAVSLFERSYFLWILFALLLSPSYTEPPRLILRPTQTPPGLFVPLQTRLLLAVLRPCRLIYNGILRVLFQFVTSDLFRFPDSSCYVKSFRIRRIIYTPAAVLRTSQIVGNIFTGQHASQTYLFLGELDATVRQFPRKEYNRIVNLDIYRTAVVFGYKLNWEVREGGLVVEIAKAKVYSEKLRDQKGETWSP